jgi:AcrR family transcriptional regulator
VTEPKEGAQPSPGLARLPPGRHGLPREFVDSNQRGRLAAGTISAVVKSGYHETTVSKIVAAAGVSRRTFYQYFSSKQECFAASYALLADHLLAEMALAGADEAEWPARVAARFGEMLAIFSANPDLALFALAAPQGAGGEALTLYRSLLERLLEVLCEDLADQALRPDRAVEEGLMGGLAAIVATAARAGEDLGGLEADLLQLFLTPYLGVAAASAAARRG